MSLIGPYQCIRTIKRKQGVHIELARHKGTGDLVVIKVAKSSALDSVVLEESNYTANSTMIQSETTVLQDLAHPNMLRMVSHGLDEECVSSHGNKFIASY
mmetsp:Transcript_15120/g.17509  ORF Transcript_15120/g.17509 Transcript_15120/m.17509 type:complete len:100 (-) Transcript_15120:36-335(-)